LERASASGAGADDDEALAPLGQPGARIGAPGGEPDVAQGTGDVRDGVAVGEGGDGKGGRAVVESGGAGDSGAPPDPAADSPVLLADRRVELAAAGERRAP
jgi:hypothetical protein